MKLNQIIPLLVACTVLMSACSRVDKNAQSTNNTSGNPGLFTYKGQPVSSTSDVVVVASELLNACNLKWGEPVEVLWQDDHNRYLVIYPTPNREKMEVGDRGIFVWTNGEAIRMPQM